MNTSPDSAGLDALVSAAVGPLGLHLESTTVGGEPEQRVLTVVVDRSEGTEGLDLDELAEATRAVSVALDAAGEDLPGLGTAPYQLEVSTPGVSRPLTEPRHWRRNVGRLVTVQILAATETGGGEPAAAEPSPALTARIQSADEAGVVLVPVRPGAKKGMPAKVGDPERHPYARLGPATVQVELTRGGAGAATGELKTEV
ncbi:ribosome maturation factor RimP [Citricoccus nitrophenolicus]|uniref:ribosome maturation factor RimP n=1 Tax=Citricoccus nitrophenolicus TaxID=863575 RepID=UPI0031E807BA